MNKKSQITIFIIVGIILLFMAGILIYSIYSQRGIEEKEKIEEVPLDIQPIKNYIDNCITQILDPGVYLLGIQGGYIYLPEETLKSDDYEAAYSLYRGNYNLISISGMEQQISAYMNNELPNCFDFTVFEEQGFKIIDQDLKTKTTIQKDKVLVEINYNLDIEKSGTQYNLNRFAETTPIRLGYIHSIADQIVRKLESDPDWVDITHLGSFDVEVSIIPFSKTDSIFAVVDNSIVDGIKIKEPFIFLIANNHIVNEPPKLQPPFNFILNSSTPFIYQVTAVDPDNDILTFSDNTPMFDITEDGIISFVPVVTGTFPVIIKVEDTHFNSDEKEAIFKIE